MRTQDFKLIVDHVLFKNQYFANGYANAVRVQANDTQGNTTVSIKADDRANIFPIDHKGDYFYLRNNPEITTNLRVAERISDCQTALAPYEDTIVCNLVAIVNDADPFSLLNNLRKSLATYKPATITTTSANWDKVQIIRDELSGAPQKDIEASLNRLKRQTIVRITCNVVIPYYSDNCQITNPCQPCPATA